MRTYAANLRHVLGRAGTAQAKNGYVIKVAGRYRLDPATVDVDVWTLRDLIRAATLAFGPKRRELLTAACALYTAPLAEGHDYEWLQPHRETVRRWSTEAHLQLADNLLDSNPQAASDLFDKAIGLGRYNEALYIKASNARPPRPRRHRRHPDPAARPDQGPRRPQRRTPRGHHHAGHPTTHQPGPEVTTTAVRPSGRCAGCGQRIGAPPYAVEASGVVAAVALPPSGRTR